MIECIVIGDSIAVGTGKHLPQCAVYAKVGITSKNWMSKFSKINLTTDATIISLGSNDATLLSSKYHIMNLRSKVTSGKVVWILPAIKPEIKAFIITLAHSHNDVVLRIPSLSKDKVHPTSSGYKMLAQQVNKIVHTGNTNE